MVVMACSVSAQNKTYTVRQGDTISGIASKLQVRQAELVAVNALTNSNVLKPGKVLRVPARSVTAKIPAAPSGASYHTVRNGENDWTLARKHGITIAKLHAMNPSVNFKKLQIGTRIAIPSAKKTVATSTPVAAKAAPAVKVAVRTESKANSAKQSSKIYKVQKNENDWLIARKFDTTTKKLKELNPNVDLEVLQIGQTIRVPGSAASTSTVASANSIKTKYAKVVKDNAIIRRGAKTTSEQITQVDTGTQVVVLDHLNGWYKLRFPKGTVGWMRGDLLKSVKTIDAVRENRTNSVVANKTAPKTSKPAVAKSTTKPAAKTAVASKAPVKKTVVASKSSTKKNPLVKSSTKVAMNRPGAPVSSTFTNSLLANANSKLGTRYRYGATGRGAYDCSSFAQSVYASQGVKLPRTSREQATVGSKVDKSNLKPGDLVFFKTGRGSRISHVGIYQGNGKFTHASSGKGKVVTSSLNEGYYQRRFVTARRPVSKSAASTKTASKAPAKKESAKPIEAAPIEGPG